MDSKKYQESYYIEGNTVKKLDMVPERKERTEERREHKVNERISRNSRRAKAFDLKYTVALTVATVILFASCINMLTMQANIAEQRREIAALESGLTELVDINDETSKRLQNSVDLTKVYDVATRELGMIYPHNGQVVSYEASNPDYVKQFKDVPTE